MKKIEFEIDDDKYEKIITYMAISEYDLDDIFLLGSHVLGLAIKTGINIDEYLLKNNIPVGINVIFNLTTQEIIDRIKEYNE